MAQIRVLPDHIINKIAAGEVVERPASVLKELLENALDAGASQIDVEINAGGRELIRVADNGSGMTRDGALLSIERHATSKITDVDDIEHVRSLGFRGEALAAISAVTRFRLCTRTAMELSGTEITMSGGKIQDVRETGCALGTMMEARNLFFNVPARRKFLRTVATEADHVRQIFITIALSRPEVEFTLTMDRRRLYTLPATSNLLTRLRELLPTVAPENLRAVNYQQNDVKISGFVGLPIAARRDRTDQYIFVNGRAASAPVLFAAIRAAYHGLLPSDRHPILFLLLQMNADMVDVNVHPTKKEVRFRDTTLTRSAVINAVTSALTSDHLALKMPASEALPDDNASKTAPPAIQPESAAPTLPAIDQFLSAMQTSFKSSARSSLAPRTAVSMPLATIAGNASCPGAPPVPVAPDNAAASETTSAPPWVSWYRLLGFIGGRYVVLETPDGLALLDPHAAHERVMYERLHREYHAQGVVVQPLLGAVTAELTPRAAARLRRHLETLRQMGFGIAEFGGDTFLVDALPACLDHRAPTELLADITAYLDDPTAGRMPIEERIMRAACHAAVKAARPLDEVQITALLEQLAQAAMPYTCPHGRPTLIHIPLQELNRKFGRE